MLGISRLVWMSAVALLTTSASAVMAATATNTFQSKIVIVAECKVQSTQDLDFGSHGVLDANVDATADIGVQCTNTTPYNVQLNAGSTSGGSIATRLMTSGSATVAYQMYKDAGRSQNWGQTNGTDTVSATGNGSVQTHTVYGRVAPQATPAPATYTDTVTVTVEY
ncbi:MAG: spore coat U domain-containing protein [Hyphomicrobiaceae bacterium]